MNNDTPRDWEELKKLAEAATPGPWEHESKKYNETIYTPRRSGPSISVSQGAGSLNSPIWGTPDMAKADAKFIAAFNPATVLELIAEVEQAHETAEFWSRQANFPTNDVIELKKLLSQLKAERDRMAEALGPFVAFEEAMRDSYGDHSDSHRYVVFGTERGDICLTVGCFRRARSALNTGETDA